jgi:copper homeostasis protein CutC
MARSSKSAGARSNSSKAALGVGAVLAEALAKKHAADQAYIAEVEKICAGLADRFSRMEPTLVEQITQVLALPDQQIAQILTQGSDGH